MPSIVQSAAQAILRFPKSISFGVFTLFVFWLSSNAYGDGIMGLFNKKETGCVFSGFDGQLLFEGKPATGAVITRKYELFDRSGEDSVTTDANGHFSFSSVIWEYKEPLLAPVDFMAYQNIYVSYRQQEFHIWTSSKPSKEALTEFDGNEPLVVCELTENPTGKDIIEGLLVTSCHW